MVSFKSINDQTARSTYSLFRGLPHFWQNIFLSHGQFNNCIPSHLPAKKYLGKLTSVYDLDLFRLTAAKTLNPDNDNLCYNRIQSRYYSLHSFNKFQTELPRRASDSCFSVLHNNVRSLRRNLENFQVHLLDELNFDFSVIGVCETKIISGKNLGF